MDYGYGQELIPQIVGTSIPCETSPAWPLFILCHFKPFSVSNPLIRNDDSVESTLKQIFFKTFTQK